MFSKLSKYIKSKQEEVALENVVKRHTASEYGLFWDIYHDLAKYAETVDSTSSDPNDKLLLMTYAYARRFAAAGLYMQGYMDPPGWEYTCDMFKGFQAATGQTKVFQEKATELCVQFLMTYSSFWTRKNVTILMLLARDLHPAPSVLDERIPYEVVLDSIQQNQLHS